MANFTDRELQISQIIGGATLIICLLFGIIGSFMLKHEMGLPAEYATCLKNTGWTMLFVAAIWTGLASWLKFSK
jgi:hypothetical protein